MRTLAFAVAFSVLGMASAVADPERGNADLKKYCTGDAMTFCGNIDPKSKAMDDCFTTHRRNLSENCRRAIDAYRASSGK